MLSGLAHSATRQKREGRKGGGGAPFRFREHVPEVGPSESRREPRPRVSVAAADPTFQNSAASGFGVIRSYAVNETPGLRRTASDRMLTIRLGPCAACPPLKEVELEKLEDKVNELASIAKDLPENLQVICFELLLRHHLEGATPRPLSQVQTERTGPTAPSDDTSDTKAVEESAETQEDLTITDLHVKVRRFLEKYSLSIEHLNNIFYKEGDRVLPLYDDLKTTRVSEGQIRITLLQALHAALNSGDFVAQVEEVRRECGDRKYYDSANFTAHFRNNKSLFDFEKYTKSTKAVKLSENGRKELAEVIKDLQ